MQRIQCRRRRQQKSGSSLKAGAGRRKVLLKTKGMAKGQEQEAEGRRGQG